MLKPYHVSLHPTENILSSINIEGVKPEVPCCIHSGKLESTG